SAEGDVVEQGVGRDRTRASRPFVEHELDDLARERGHVDGLPDPGEARRADVDRLAGGKGGGHVPGGGGGQTRGGGRLRARAADGGGMKNGSVGRSIGTVRTWVMKLERLAGRYG